MLFRRRLLVPVLSLAMVLASGSAGACSPPATSHNLKAALASARPGLIVFRGQIESAEGAETSEQGARARQYVIRADKWWRGPDRARMAARGSVNTMAGTSCQGLFDFSAEQGEQWLIVGHEEDGIFAPSGLLSQKLENGMLPLALRQLLESTAQVNIE